MVLEAVGLTAGYGDLPAVRNVNLEVGQGEMVALLGPNGAGKTTTMSALAGVLKPMAGQIRWRGEPVSLPLHRRVRNGLAYVSEDRNVLASLSVLDNLRLGSGDPGEAVEIFPELGPLLKRRAGLLSGGEQQMLTLGRALASHPSALLVDEVSLGLAPQVVQRLLVRLHRAAKESGVAIMLVEQQARRVLDVADRWYLLRSGEIIAAGVPADWAEDMEAMFLSGRFDMESAVLDA
jgi:branched-chain amino acid transport system ATP-binding protein